jgi:hypothetical protein
MSFSLLFLLLSLSIPQKQRFQKENSKKRDRIAALGMSENPPMLSKRRL